MKKNVLLYLSLIVSMTLVTVFLVRLSGYSRQNVADLMNDGIVAYANKKYSKAFSSFEKAAAMGNAEATFILGSLYMNGSGVAKNATKAVSLYTVAAEAGYAPAQYTLALMNMDGSFLPKNVKKAAAYITAAAESGDVEAMSTLALWFERGLFGTPDPEQAVFWYTRAARLGDSNAQTALSLFYTKGLNGVPVDYKKSVYWNNVLKKKKEYTDRFSGKKPTPDSLYTVE